MLYVSLFFLDAAPELVITRTSVPNNAWALSVQLINQLYIITRYKISVQANRSIKPAKIGHRQLFNKGLDPRFPTLALQPYKLKFKWD
jgi:hypothetical protein